jgi:hypothetical protein
VVRCPFHNPVSIYVQKIKGFRYTLVTPYQMKSAANSDGDCPPGLVRRSTVRQGLISIVGAAVVFFTKDFCFFFDFEIGSGG